ncbi:MAG: DoxX family membrane protein [Isosphaeraceae bacterium]|nr:DoxX family membrane protein [Isosphaeraceae bacterium]
MLLRTAIGWHFTYEALTKIYSTPEGRDSFLAVIFPPPPAPLKGAEPPFSAEGYLRASTGPLAPYFRSLVPDVDSLDKLDLAKLKQRWQQDLDRYARHYQFDNAQRQEAEKILAAREAEAEAWFRDPEHIEKIQEYKDDLAHVDRVLADPKSLAFERERAYHERKELDATRRELAGVVDGWTKNLHDAWSKLGGRGELAPVAPPPPLWTQMDWINVVTMYGMLAVGVLLLLGLLTPAAALGAAAYLTLFYLSMPPWPHIPPSPQSEGHYLFVNKNLIELLACLVLASTPNGLWVGLDALLFGRWARRRRQRAEEAEAMAVSEGPPEQAAART